MGLEEVCKPKVMYKVQPHGIVGSHGFRFCSFEWAGSARGKPIQGFVTRVATLIMSQVLAGYQRI